MHCGDKRSRPFQFARGSWKWPLSSAEVWDKPILKTPVKFQIENDLNIDRLEIVKNRHKILKNPIFKSIFWKEFECYGKLSYIRKSMCLSCPGSWGFYTGLLVGKYAWESDLTTVIIMHQISTCSCSRIWIKSSQSSILIAGYFEKRYAFITALKCLIFSWYLALR